MLSNKKTLLIKSRGLKKVSLVVNNWLVVIIARSFSGVGIIKNIKDVELLVEGLKKNGTNGFVPSIENFNLVMDFYKKIMSVDGFLEKGLDKKPINSVKNREPSMSLTKISETLQKNQFEIRFSFGEDAEVFTIYDFDLHKIIDENLRWHFFSSICIFAIEKDLTLVLTPRLGLHLYFDFDKKNSVIGKTRSIDRILKCLIPKVDILTTGSFIGPSLARPLLHLSTRWKTFEQKDFFVVPHYMLPLSDGKDSKADLKLLEKLPGSIDVLIKKGCRRRCLLDLYKKCNVNAEDIININNYFFSPPKETLELEKEVIDILPSIVLKNSAFSSITDIKKLSHSIAFDRSSNNFILWNQDSLTWEIKGFNQVVKVIAEYSGEDEDFYYKRKNIILDQIKSELDICLIKKETNNNFVLRTGCKKYVNLLWRGGKVEYDIVSDPELIKNNYNYKAFQQQINFQDLVNSINEVNGECGHNFLNLVQKLCPKVFAFLRSKFKFDSEELNISFTLLLIRIILFVFLKNFDSYKDLSVQKFLLLFGQAASGKSAVMSLIQKMVPSPDIYNGSFSTLGGRFETSFMMDKLLHCFSDEDVNSLLGKDTSSKVNIFKKLTSGIDQIRVEKKFGEVSSFVNKGLVVITSNNINIVDTESDYGAMTRRSICIPFFQSISGENQNDSLVSEIIRDEFSALAVLAFFVTSDLDNFKKKISTFDTGREATKYREYKCYEMFCDPYANFLELIVEADTERSNNTFVSWKHFSCIYLQYVIFRKGSTIEVNNIELLIEQLNIFMKDFNYGKTDGLKGDLAFFTSLFKEGIITMKSKTKLFSLESHAINQLFTDRLPFLIKKLKLVNETVDREQVDFLGKKYTTRVSGFRGLLFKKSILKEMPENFSFVGVKTELGNEKEEKKWLFDEENHDIFVNTDEKVLFPANHNYRSYSTIINYETISHFKGCSKNIDICSKPL